MREVRIELLQRMPIFGGIREDTLRFVLELAPIVRVRANEFFFRENDSANAMFVLETGRVAVFKSWEGEECLLHYLTKGDCFGEMALMDLLPRSASVRALEDCSAIELSTHTLYRIYEKDLEQFTLMQMNMGREVCRRLRDADERLFRVHMGTLAPNVGAGDDAFRST
jgi:CRP/FNR family cyclic AMP-dependent transcriptional regulator